MKKNFKNKWTTAPVDVEDGDAFAVKVVAVAGYDLSLIHISEPTRPY